MLLVCTKYACLGDRLLALNQQTVRVIANHFLNHIAILQPVGKIRILLTQRKILCCPVKRLLLQDKRSRFAAFAGLVLRRFPPCTRLRMRMHLLRPPHVQDYTRLLLLSCFGAGLRHFLRFRRGAAARDQSKRHQNGAQHPGSYRFHGTSPLYDRFLLV